MAALAHPVVKYTTASISRFTTDVALMGTQLSTDGDIGGPATDDLHQLRADA